MPQDPEEPNRRTNYLRWGCGVGVGVAPFVLPVVSLCVGPPSSELATKLSALTTVPGIACVALGLLVTLVNAHLAFLPPYLYRRRHSSLDRMRNVSGIPAVGTFAVLLGCVLAFGHRPTAFIALLVLALDSGGLPWFLIATWRDASFWDK